VQSGKIQPVEIFTYDTLPPYAYRDEQGQLTGLYVEIVTAAVARMPEYSLSFTVLPWARVKYNAKHGTAFAILAPYFHAHDWLTDTEPVKPYIWPYSLPLYTQEDVVICNANVLLTARKNFPEDYTGLSFVMWRGDGRAKPAFNQLVEDKKIKLTLVNSIKDTVALIQQGWQDCTLTAKQPFYWYLAQYKKSREFQNHKNEVTLVETVVVSSNDGFLGYTDINSEENYPYKKDFTIKFDIEIYKMKQSGELNDIINRFVNHEIND
jgi:polar amino acid transport system substrate-binding protein